MSISELVLDVLTFILFIALAWFTYCTANIAYTIFKKKRHDKTMKFCFTRMGWILFIGFSVIFVVAYVIAIIFIYSGFGNNNVATIRIAIDVLALLTLLYSWTISNTILLGSKEMMIGRFLVDYRKMKKVTYGLDGKVSFIYAQKEYTFSTTFSDLKQIRKAIKR